jgi:hypothetical protein
MGFRIDEIKFMNLSHADKFYFSHFQSTFKSPMTILFLEKLKHANVCLLDDCLLQRKPSNSSLVTTSWTINFL